MLAISKKHRRAMRDFRTNLRIKLKNPRRAANAFNVFHTIYLHCENEDMISLEAKFIAEESFLGTTAYRIAITDLHNMGAISIKPGFDDNRAQRGNLFEIRVKELIKK